MEGSRLDEVGVFVAWRLHPPDAPVTIRRTIGFNPGS